VFDLANLHQLIRSSHVPSPVGTSSSSFAVSLWDPKLLVRSSLSFSFEPEERHVRIGRRLTRRRTL